MINISYETKKRIKRMIIPLIAFLFVLIAASYAYIRYTASGKETNVIKSGCLRTTLTETTSGISLANAIPITDADGISGVPYTYTIENTCNLTARYETTFNILNTSTLANGAEGGFKIYITGPNDLVIGPKILNNFETTILDNGDTDIELSYIVDSGYLAQGESATFNLRMWIDYNATYEMAGNSTLNGRLVVNSFVAEILQFEQSTAGYYVYRKNNIASQTDNNPNFNYLAPNNDGSIIQTSGLFKGMGENDKPVYYFRGANVDNYVKFGKYATGVSVTYTNAEGNSSSVTHAQGDDMIWRIIRINEDGSIKMILDDTIGNAAFNINVNEAKYVGYTYVNSGPQIDSNIKDILDTWYETHLKTSYEKHIADNVFCNDRTYTNHNFSGFDRLATNKTPSFLCQNSEDKYTVSNIGNGLLTNPIGLMTADEVIFAGSNFTNPNTNYYLAKNINSFWTMTPSRFVTNAMNFTSTGEANVNTSYSVRPVINLKSNVDLAGSGTSADPYIIK